MPDELDSEREPPPSDSARAPIVAPPPKDISFQDAKPVSAAAATLLNVACRGGSVLTDHNVWTDENIGTLIERFVKQPDVSGGSFFSKLDKQLDGVKDDVRILFAEILLLQMLPLGQLRRETKIGNIERTLLDVDTDYQIPEQILDALDAPVFGGGVAFGTRRYWQLSVLIEFVRYFRSLSTEEQDEAVTNPLAWRKVVTDSPGTPEPSLRASLTYLGHPNYFLPIVADRHKRDIVQSFFPQHTGRQPSDDYDVDLAMLRAWMDPPGDSTPNFYVPPLSSYWLDEEVEPDESDPFSQGTDDDTYAVDSIVQDGAFHSPADLRAIIDRWKATRNIVLQGAPGVGKSWLARRLAFALIGKVIEAAVRSVQFHPGTSYEDFVRGWRPGSDQSLELVDGPLLQHAERARQNPDIPHVLIIEEFNRGNPAQALGEMLTLLEHSKRNEADALELTYMRPGEKRFALPDNLYVIGTMNTADRSLALVDFALRRRFAFFDLEPQLNGAWKGYLAERFRSVPKEQIDEVARRIIAMNDRIANDPGLGPAFRIGHSYFTPEKEASEFWPWFEAAVRSSVRPQLTEYWYEDPDTVAEVVADLLAEL